MSGLRDEHAHDDDVLAKMLEHIVGHLRCDSCGHPRRIVNVAGLEQTPGWWRWRHRPGQFGHRL